MVTGAAVALLMGVVAPGIAQAATPTVSARATNTATYVALGDSYSSGEGLPGPKPDQWLSTLGVPWSSTDRCDRSALAYPSLVANDEGTASNYEFVACSGAVTGSTEDASPYTSGATSLLLGKRGGESSQLGALTTDTKIVSVTVGGDDLGFVKVLAACVGLMVKLGPLHRFYSSKAPGASAAKCNSDLAQSKTIATSAAGTVPSLEGALIDTYTKILDAAPNATLYVLNYPQLFSVSKVSTFCPLTGAIRVGPASVYLGVGPSQLTDINGLEIDLNADIAAAVQQVSETLGTGRIEVVDINTLTTSEGQTCNTKTLSKSLINGVILSLPNSITALYGDCFRNGGLIPHCGGALSAAESNIVAKGSVHPKPAGQALMAMALESAIQASATSSPAARK
jgi:lysophospholipase L1-like esterase